MKIGLLLALALLFVGCINPTSVATDDVKTYEEGKALYDKEEYEGAIADFMIVVNDFPWSSKVDNSFEYWGKSLLALAADNSELYDSAFAVFMKIPEKSSGYVEGQYYAGVALHERYYNDKAISRDSTVSHLYGVYSSWPKNSYGKRSIELIVSLFLAEDEEDSAAHYAAMIGESIDDSLSIADKETYSSARSLYIAATKSDALADYDKAITALKAYQNGAKSDSLFGEAGFYIAKSYYRSDRYEEALPWLKATLGDGNVSRETLEEALYRKGYALQELDSLSGAKNALESYADLYEDGSYKLYAWRYLGSISLLLMDTVTAVNWYEKVIDEDSICSSDEEALLTLGEISYKRDAFEVAREALESYLDRYPNESAGDAANSYRMIGHCYRKENNLIKAQEWFEEGLARDEFKDGSYYDNLLYWAGDVAYDLKQSSKAKEHLEMYLQLYPDGSYKVNAESTLTKINGGY